MTTLLGRKRKRVELAPTTQSNLEIIALDTGLELRFVFSRLIRAAVLLYFKRDPGFMKLWTELEHEEVAWGYHKQPEGGVDG